MNFSEVVNEVLSLTKRPDKVTQAENAVNSRLARCILKGEFSHDLVETTIPIDDTLYAQLVDLSTLASPLTRFRKWKYLKQPGALKYLEPGDVSNVFRPGGYTQSDIFYMIGSTLNIITSSLSSTLEVGYYQYAPALKNNETHWLLDICPYAIINLATGELFNSMGDVGASKYYIASGEDLFQTLVRDMRDQITY